MMAWLSGLGWTELACLILGTLAGGAGSKLLPTNNGQSPGDPQNGHGSRKLDIPFQHWTGRFDRIESKLDLTNNLLSQIVGLLERK